MVDHNLFVLSFEMFICASQCVNGNVMFIKLFPVTALLFGDISSALVQGWILNKYSSTWWPSFTNVSSMSSLQGCRMFHAILQEEKPILSKYGWDSILNLQFYLSDSWKNPLQTRLWLCTLQIWFLLHFLLACVSWFCRSQSYHYMTPSLGPLCHNNR